MRLAYNNKTQHVYNNSYEYYRCVLQQNYYTGNILISIDLLFRENLLDPKHRLEWIIFKLFLSIIADRFIT